MYELKMVLCFIRGDLIKESVITHGHTDNTEMSLRDASLVFDCSIHRNNVVSEHQFNVGVVA